MKQRPRARAGIAAVAALLGLLAVRQPPASAAVSHVKGVALGYWAHNVSLFGGGQPETGPTPVACLSTYTPPAPIPNTTPQQFTDYSCPSTSAPTSPKSASAPCGYVAYGPATLLTSDAITIQSAGSVGTTGSVNSTSSITNINKATTTNCNGVDLTALTGSQILTADKLTGTANANETAATGSGKVTNGKVATHSNSFNCTSVSTPCGGHTHDPANPEGLVDIPASPSANYKVAGHVHLSDSSTDYYVIVFNEKIKTGTSIVVNPVHEYLGYKLDASGNIVKDLPQSQGGSVLQGHLYLGQVVAGLTATSTGPHSDLAVDIIGDSPDPVARRQPVTYTASVTNGGPDTVSDVSLTSIVSGTTGATVTSASAGGGGTCTIPSRRKAICQWSSMAVGSNTVTITVKAPRTAGSITLTSTVSSTTNNDPTASNNSDAESTSVV